MCDFDSSPAFRQKIINRFKEIWGEDKVLQVATFSTLKPKAAIKRACKGLGVPNEEAEYMASLIPVVRGEAAPLEECFAMPEMRAMLDEYPGLDETALVIENTIVGLGTHAGGVCMYNEPYVNQLAMMRSPKMTAQTCFDLHDAEATGTTKFDVLTTTAMEFIRKCIMMLVNDGYIEWKGSLKDTYESVIGLDNLIYDDEKMWEQALRMPQMFQFETAIGVECFKKVKPRNIDELTAANSLMRLMPAGWSELPVDRYIRYADENEFIKDATEFGLNADEINVIKEVCGLERYMTISQEMMMLLSMRPETAGFTYKEANKLRKSVAKKSAEAQEEAKQMFYEWCDKQGTREVFADYVWNMFSAQFGYAFSVPHALSYSLVALQEINLFYRFPEEYWSAAVLNVEGIANDESSGAGVDYTKVTKIIYKMKDAGVNVEPPKINLASNEFKVDANSHKIYFSLSAIPLINEDDYNTIVAGRPYRTMRDFIERINPTNSKMINLIKAECFGDASKAMKQYAKILAANDMPEKFTTVHAKKFPSILPDTYEAIIRMVMDIKSDKNYLGTQNKKKIYRLEDKYEEFVDALKYESDYWQDDGGYCITASAVDKALKKELNELKEYLTTQEYADAYYVALIDKKYTELVKESGNTKLWEFAATSYYHGNNIYSKNIMKNYGFVGFNDMPEEAEWEEQEFRGRSWRKYHLYSMPVTVIGKNDMRNAIFCLTADDKVISCKMQNGEYAFYKAKPSWFNRGECLILHGYRSGDGFKLKKYASSSFEHTIYHVDAFSDRKLVLSYNK